MLLLTNTPRLGADWREQGRRKSCQIKFRWRKQGPFLEQCCRSSQFPDKHLNTLHQNKKLLLLRSEAANPAACGDVPPREPERVRTPLNQITAPPAAAKESGLVSAARRVSLFAQALLSLTSKFFPSSYDISVENMPKHVWRLGQAPD